MSTPPPQLEQIKDEILDSKNSLSDFDTDFEGFGELKQQEQEQEEEEEEKEHEDEGEKEEESEEDNNNENNNKTKSNNKKKKKQEQRIPLTLHQLSRLSNTEVVALLRHLRIDRPVLLYVLVSEMSGGSIFCAPEDFFKQVQIDAPANKILNNMIVRLKQVVQGLLMLAADGGAAARAARDKREQEERNKTESRLEELKSEIATVQAQLDAFAQKLVQEQQRCTQEHTQTRTDVQGVKASISSVSSQVSTANFTATTASSVANAANTTAASLESEVETQRLVVAFLAEKVHDVPAASVPALKDLFLDLLIPVSGHITAQVKQTLVNFCGNRPTDFFVASPAALKTASTPTQLTAVQISTVTNLRNVLLSEGWFRVNLVTPALVRVITNNTAASLANATTFTADADANEINEHMKKVGDAFLKQISELNPRTPTSISIVCCLIVAICRDSRNFQLPTARFRDLARTLFTMAGVLSHEGKTVNSIVTPDVAGNYFAALECVMRHAYPSNDHGNKNFYPPNNTLIMQAIFNASAHITTAANGAAAKRFFALLARYFDDNAPENRALVTDQVIARLQSLANLVSGDDADSGLFWMTASHHLCKDPTALQRVKANLSFKSTALNTVKPRISLAPGRQESKLCHELVEDKLK